MGKLVELISPENEMIKSGLKAVDDNDIENALLFLDCTLLINPDNQQAKQKLLEIYPKAIQDIIDDGRYEDALLLAEKALDLEEENLAIKYLYDALFIAFSKRKLNNVISIKEIALAFIRIFSPEEEILFDSLWNALKNIKSGNLFFSKKLHYALSLPEGYPENIEDMNSTIIIASLVQGIGKDKIEIGDIKSFKANIIDTARRNRASKEVIAQLNRFLSGFEQ